MGMFNYIRVNCPECDAIVEFQSKSGDCSLSTYHISRMPVEDIRGIEGDIERCPVCDYPIMVDVEEDAKEMGDFSGRVK